MKVTFKATFTAEFQFERHPDDSATIGYLRDSVQAAAEKEARASLRQTEFLSPKLLSVSVKMTEIES